MLIYILQKMINIFLNNSKTILRKLKNTKIRIKKKQSEIFLIEFNFILIKRKFEPYKDYWAIPGGYVEYG